MLFSGSVGQRWDVAEQSQRASRIVFIGKGYRSCVAASVLVAMLSLASHGGATTTTYRV